MNNIINIHAKRVTYLVRLLSIVGFGLILTINTGFAGSNSWTVKKSVNTGQTIQIQTMYNITSRGAGVKCRWDHVPPKPIEGGKRKLGTIFYRSGKADPLPRQCSDVKIDANFADYTAGKVAGLDKFWIKWRTERGNFYTVTYRIRVK